MDNKSFEEQIKIENKCNNDKWEWDRHCAATRGEDIYTAFCLWCNCQGDIDNKLRSNSQVFANWLKRHNITLTDYQRRCIAENHFGWKFTWNSDLNKWEEKKL